MHYYIERHDMEMILDALEALRNNIEHGLEYPYTIDEVDGLVQALSSGDEHAEGSWVNKV